MSPKEISGAFAIAVILLVVGLAATIAAPSAWSSSLMALGVTAFVATRSAMLWMAWRTRGDQRGARFEAGMSGSPPGRLSSPDRQSSSARKMCAAVHALQTGRPCRGRPGGSGPCDPGRGTRPRTRAPSACPRDQAAEGAALDPVRRELDRRGRLGRVRGRRGEAPSASRRSPADAGLQTVQPTQTSRTGGRSLPPLFRPRQGAEVLDSAPFGGPERRTGRTWRAERRAGRRRHRRMAGRARGPGSSRRHTRSPLPGMVDARPLAATRGLPVSASRRPGRARRPFDGPPTANTLHSRSGRRDPAARSSRSWSASTRACRLPALPARRVPRGRAAHSPADHPAGDAGRPADPLLSAGISFGYVIERGGLEMPATAGASDGLHAEALLTEEPAATDGPSATPLDTPAASPNLVSPSRLIVTLRRARHRRSLRRPSPTPRPTRQTDAQAHRRRRGAAAMRCSSPALTAKAAGSTPSARATTSSSIANYFGVKLAVIYAWNPRYQAGAHPRRRQGPDAPAHPLGMATR